MINCHTLKEQLKEFEKDHQKFSHSSDKLNIQNSILSYYVQYHNKLHCPAWRTLFETITINKKSNTAKQARYLVKNIKLMINVARLNKIIFSLPMTGSERMLKSAGGLCWGREQRDGDDDDQERQINPSVTECVWIIAHEEFSSEALPPPMYM
jgi:hypothetical protein